MVYLLGFPGRPMGQKPMRPAIDLNSGHIRTNDSVRCRACGGHVKGPTLKVGQTACNCDVGWTTSAKMPIAKKTLQDSTDAKWARKLVDLSKPTVDLSKPLVKPIPQQSPKADITQ